MAVNDKITTHPNTFYRTWQSYTGSDNGPMKTWDGVLVAGSDYSGAQAVTVIDTTVPQDSYMMGGFSIEWFESYASTNAKTSITLSGYWNAQSNGGFIGWEYTSSNPNIVPTIRIARNVSTGNTSFILTHFNSNYAIILARDLWLGYSGGDATYGSGWTIKQQADTTGYTNIVSVTARTAMPAGSGSGSGLNADLLDGIDSTGFVRSNANTSGYISIDGGSQNAPNDGTVYITATNNNDWGLIVNKYNSSATEYGIDVRMGAGAAYAFRVNGNGTEKMRINGEGQIFSPLYYDYNNSGYYLDPTSTTALRTVGSWRADAAAWDGEFSGKIQYHSNHWYIQAADLFIYRNAGGSNVFTINQSGTAIANADMRAPIFYDNNDTNFYVDPNGTSRIRKTNLIASGSGWDDGLNLYSSDQSNRWNLLVDNGAADSLRFAFNNSEALSINTSRNVIANVDIRAPIFYDSNDTNYYADPASTSRFNAIIANSINIPGVGGSSSNQYVFNCTASGTQARRFEIARIGIDYNDWNSVGGFEVELHENYFGSGLIKKYTVYYGYVSNFGVHLTHYSGSGSNQFRVTTSGEVTVSGDHRYISVFVDVDYYSGVTATVRTTRNITTTNPPPVGSTFIFSTPTVTNIAGFSADSTVFVPTIVQAGGDFRAPIFYDSNDTNFYVDPNGTSRLATLNITSGFNTRSSDVYADMRVIRSGGSDGMYIGYANSSGGVTRIYGGGSSGGELIKYSNYSEEAGSFRAPIFYDSNNTGFYLDPNGTSELNRINTVRANNFLYLDNNYGHSIVGVYSASRYQGVFAMGDAYKLPADGTSPSNLYGIAWSHPNAGGVAGNLNTHGALIMENGTFLAALSGSVRARDDMRAPIFYDSNNTGFYVDPNGTSNLNVLNVGTLNISGTIPTNTSYLRRMSDRDFGSGTLVQTNINYAVTNGDPFVIEITGNSYGQIVPWDIQIQGYIYADTIINTAGISNGTNISGIRAINYNGNLCFWWPRQSYWNGFTVYVYVPYSTFQTNRVTSISDSAQPTTAKQVVFTVYQNYSNYNSTSFDATFNRLYSNTDVRAPIYYDSNNTGYYVDPTGGTSLRTVGDWRADSSGWTGEFAGKIQYHSNNWYFQYNTEFLFRNAGGSNVFYGDNGGNTWAISSSRAPIFYDSNNTGYYTDPASYSQFSSGEFNNYVRAARHTMTGVGGDSGVGTEAYAIHQESGGWSFPYPDLRIAYHVGIKLGANPSYEGIRFYTDYDMSSRVMQVNGGSNYIYMDRWVNVAGNQGIYSSTNGAHFYPNGASYGAWRIDGSRNGWGGIEFQAGNTTLMMNDDTYGFHRNNGGGWRFYVSSGSGYFPGEVTAYWSDRRLKENIETLSFGEGTTLINKLKPSRFNWRTDLEEIAPNLKGAVKPGKEEVGLIAQEVQEVLPDAVKENLSGRSAGKGSSTESYLTVNYDRIVPFLIQAIHELTAKVAELEKQINGKN
jgi:hypothetical protein